MPETWAEWSGKVGLEHAVLNFPVNFLSEQLPSFGAESHREVKLTVLCTQNAFRGSFQCASAVN